MHRSTPGSSAWCALLVAGATASCGGEQGGSGSETAGTGTTASTDATSGPTSAPTSAPTTGASTTAVEAPTLATFVASPSAVPPGAPTQVTWTWTYADPPDPAPSCSIDNGVGAVESGAATSVTLADDTTFTLTCTNAAGEDSAQTTVTVGTAAIIPPERLPPPGTWESAGVEGGIPVRDTVCADVTQAPYNADPTGNASASAAIQAAIDACPDNQVVYLPEGTYRVDLTLRITRPITLRGAGAGTVLRAETGDARALAIGGHGPRPPKINPAYNTPITGGAARASTSVTVADTAPIEVGKMIMVDEEDDPELVWTKVDAPGRYRASMHMVESKTATTVTFRPPLPIDFTRDPQLSWFPDLAHDVGVEYINFLGTGAGPSVFVEIFGAWNAWVLACEFSAMPKKTVMVAWSGHVELRRIYMHDQANGGPDSEGLDLLADVNWSLVIDNICVAAGFPQINIGDGGANPNYSGGFGNVVAYNYCVDAFYTDPPDAPDAGKMPSDISTNHSPHTQYNLIEGNIAGKFGSDAYHGSGSHTVMLRNLVTGASSWPGVSNHTSIQIDRRNLYYSLVGNVLGRTGSPASLAYASESGWSGSAIYRLGFPDIGNDAYSGTFPPMALLHGDGGPRDLYVDRDDTTVGTTLIEGNWDSTLSAQDWTIAPQPIPDSLFLPGKPSWFGSLSWPPIDPADPVTDDPTIIPAGYRYIHGSDPPP